MTDMIERVARGIAAALHDNVGEDLRNEWAATPQFRRYAQAAIEAMREPTDEMTWQGSKARAGTGSLSGAENTEATWRAMIDAALLSREGAAT